MVSRRTTLVGDAAAFNFSLLLIDSFCLGGAFKRDRVCFSYYNKNFASKLAIIS